MNEIAILQRKALRIITFNNRFTPAEPLFKESKIFKLSDIIKTNNCLLALNHINNELPENFKEFFIYSNNQHNHGTRGAYKNKITLPQVNTTQYGLQSIKYR